LTHKITKVIGIILRDKCGFKSRGMGPQHLDMFRVLCAGIGLPIMVVL